MTGRFRSFVLFFLAFGMLTAAAAWRTEPPKSTPAEERLPALRQDGPRYWKGNLHTHSLWSDGDDFPEMIADWYKQRGYDFLALSDHNILAEGERWVDVPEKGTRGLALQKYRTR